MAVHTTWHCVNNSLPRYQYMRQKRVMWVLKCMQGERCCRWPVGSSGCRCRYCCTESGVSSAPSPALSVPAKPLGNRKGSAEQEGKCRNRVRVQGSILTLFQARVNSFHALQAILPVFRSNSSPKDDNVCILASMLAKRKAEAETSSICVYRRLLVFVSF